MALYLAFYVAWMEWSINIKYTQGQFSIVIFFLSCINCIILTKSLKTLIIEEVFFYNITCILHVNEELTIALGSKTLIIILIKVKQPIPCLINISYTHRTMSIRRDPSMPSKKQYTCTLSVKWVIVALPMTNPLFPHQRSNYKGTFTNKWKYTIQYTYSLLSN